MGTTRITQPEEVIRCMKICTQTGSICKDAEGARCSYKSQSAGVCILNLLTDAAALLDKAYTTKEGAQ